MAGVPDGASRRLRVQPLQRLLPVSTARRTWSSSAPPGVGKTHLAISLAVAAAERGRRIYYEALADLITSLEEAQAAGKFQHRLRVLTYPALLIVDEIGCVPISRTGATLFFQLVNQRYEVGSTILASKPELRGVGSHLRRRGHGHRADRPTAPPLPHRQHPGEQLPHEAAR